MRTMPLMGVLLFLAVAAGCTSPERRPGEAAPAGSPRPTASGTAPASPATTPPATRPPATPTAAPASTGRRSEIRRTDWRNVTVQGLTFCGEADGVVSFRNGSNGNDVPCRMLQGGARPVYAEFIAEEPANAPVTEDALVLVELGNPGAARQQALVPIQIGFDGRTRQAWPVIKGDGPSPAGDKVMTFTSYRVTRELVVVATVKRLDGGSETRRYRRVDGGGNWKRF